MVHGKQVPDVSPEYDRPTTLVGMDAHSRKLSLCISTWVHGSDPHVVRRITDLALSNMEQAYRNNVPGDSLTILEASTNSFAIAKRLRKAGYRCAVVCSDILCGISRKDHVNDRIDAENLTVAYARFGEARARVFVPSDLYAAYRDILFGYRNSVKDTTRISNRIWSFCSAHGMPLPSRKKDRKVAEVGDWAGSAGLEPLAKFHVDSLLLEYQHALERSREFYRQICRAILGNESMTRVLQVPGIGLVTAFALVAYVEDVHRFSTPSKLVAYVGLNPCVNSSGESDDPHVLSSFGQRMLKGLLVETGQSLLRRNVNHGISRWARAKYASGKPYLCMCIAAARKSVVYAWHALMGHPTPDTESERMMATKLGRLYGILGKDAMKEQGFDSAAAFAKSITVPLYAHLKKEELQTPASR